MSRLGLRHRFRRRVPILASDPDNGEFNVGTPVPLFRGPYQNPGGMPYGIEPSGERFLMLQSVSGESRRDQINIVLNWFEELKERVPVP